MSTSAPTRPSNPWIAPGVRDGGSQHLRACTRRSWLLMLGVLGAQGAALVRARAVVSAGNPVVRDAPRWLRSRRGAITDLHGEILADGVELGRVTLRLGKLAALSPVARDQALRQLAQAFALDLAELRTRASEPGELLLGTNVPHAQLMTVRPLEAILRVEHERYRRVYPNGRLAAHVLGFVDREAAGVEGVERTLHTVLAGSPVKVPMLRDVHGRVVSGPTLPDDAQPRARSVRLTLDLDVQRVAECALERAVHGASARAGHVVALRPDTGAVVALASYPTYAPGAPGADASVRWNHAVASSFEPGSVMKAFLLAGAIAAGAIDPRATFDCEGGTLRIGKKVIKDTHENRVLSVEQILVKSSNVGAVKIGASLGRRGLFDVYRSFGFAARTGIPLPVESAGVLRDCRTWSEIETANMAFGQGLSVTNVQLAAAMGALAKEGRLMVPYLLDAVVDEREGVVVPTAPQVRGQAVPAEVARLVAKMLEGVVKPRETGADAGVPGVSVAGKTGTAQKAVAGRGYVDDVYTATFAGFFPTERPVLAISVVIDEPRGDHYGGSVAGPVFKAIAEHVRRRP